MKRRSLKPDNPVKPQPPRLVTAPDVTPLLGNTRPLRHARFVPVLAIVAAAMVAYLFSGLNQDYLPRYGKGSVGIVEGDLFVVTGGDVNQVLTGHSGRDEWTGKPRLQDECVTVEGNRVQPFAWTSVLRRPVVVCFGPKRIDIYNLRTFTSGNYLRRTD
jgi:hypothetical protein